MTFRMIILLAIACFGPKIIVAQGADAVLSKFFAVQVDETVFLRWTISAGNTCEDTYVERSDDGLSYERIGLIGGICGSPDQDITFEFTDTMPLVNRTSYYRLLLGYFGYTSPKTVEFVRYNDQGYFIGPNPFSNYSRIAFVNSDNEEFRLMLSGMQGHIVINMMTTGNEFIIRRDDLGSGIYAGRLFKGGNAFARFKLIVN